MLLRMKTYYIKKDFIVTNSKKEKKEKKGINSDPPLLYNWQCGKCPRATMLLCNVVSDKTSAS